MRRYISMILALVLSFSVVFAGICIASEVEDLKDEKNYANDELDELENQLMELMVELDEVECDIIEKRAEAQEVSANYDVAMDKLEEQYEEMKIRIQYMYEHGDIAFVEMLLSSDGYAEMLNKAEYIQQITEYDRRQLEEYGTALEETRQLKITLDTQLEQLETLQNKLAQKQEELATLIMEKEAEIEDIDRKIETALIAAQKQREEAQRKAAEQASREAAEQASREQASKEAASEESSSQQEMTEIATEETTEAATENQTEETSTQENTENDTETPQEAEASTGATDVVSLAYQLIGTPYMSGGASPSGFDCSGFTYYLYSQVGITIPRTSYGQTIGGTAVASIEEAQPGDIVCYVGHVGLYVGDNQIIHATVPGDVVRLSGVNYSSWQKVVAIRRYN